MQETETKIKKTILGNTKAATHLNEKSNLNKSHDIEKSENPSERISA